MAVFIDSKSSVEVIFSVQRSQCYLYITEIRQLANEISSKGTRVSLLRIPSHVGTEGNEKADQLANYAHRNADQSVKSNLMTSRELSRSLREAWLDTLLPQLKLWEHGTPLQPNFRVKPWVFHNNRSISTALHCLRCGHSRLKDHTSCFKVIQEDDPDEDNSGGFRDQCCRFGSDAVENERHVILQ